MSEKTYIPYDTKNGYVYMQAPYELLLGLSDKRTTDLFSTAYTYNINKDNNYNFSIRDGLTGLSTRGMTLVPESKQYLVPIIKDTVKTVFNTQHKHPRGFQVSVYLSNDETLILFSGWMREKRDDNIYTEPIPTMLMLNPEKAIDIFKELFDN